MSKMATTWWRCSGEREEWIPEIEGGDRERKVKTGKWWGERYSNGWKEGQRKTSIWRYGRPWE